MSVVCQTKGTCITKLWANKWAGWKTVYLVWHNLSQTCYKILQLMNFITCCLLFPHLPKMMNLSKQVSIIRISNKCQLNICLGIRIRVIGLVFRVRALLLHWLENCMYIRIINFRILFDASLSTRVWEVLKKNTYVTFVYNLLNCVAYIEDLNC